MRRKSLLLAVTLLLVATCFRTWQIDRVPPGLHHDEVINAEIVEDEIWAGHPSIFYTTGGREGLFHLTLAASMRWMGYSPLGMRWPGFAWGLIALAAIYALAARLLDRRVALLALAFAATSFWSVYEGRTATRSVSMIALGTLAALTFFVAWHRACSSRRTKAASGTRFFALAGVVLGLTCYTYIASRVIPLVFVLLVGYLFITRRRTLQKTGPCLLVYFFTAAIVAAPLAIYLLRYPSADMRFQMLTQPVDELRRGNLMPVAGTLLKTLGMFVWRGDSQWHYNVAGMPLLDPLCSMLFIVGLVTSLWRIRQTPHAFYLIWLLVSLIPGTLSEPAPHYMRTAGAQSALYTLLGIGSSAIAASVTRLARRYNKLVWPVLALIWIGASLRTCWNFFIVWPANDQVRFYHQANLSEMARYLDARADTTPVVGCSPFLDEQEDWLRSSRQTMHFLLRRTDLPIRWSDCRDSLVFPNGGAPWRQFILYLTPSEKDFQPPVMRWLAGASPAPIEDSADVTLYMLDRQRQLAEALAQANRAEASLGPEAGDAQAALPAALPADFGHSLNFLGYTVEEPAVRPGEKLVLTTYWQAIGQPPPFLKAFVHLLDAPDHIVAQADRQSVLADTLQVGDVFLQVHTIELPPDVPSGIYRLSIGLYSSRSGERLPVYRGQTRQGDRLMLQTVTVEPTG